MTTRNILNYEGRAIGQLTLADDTTEEQWEEALSGYAAPVPVIDPLDILIENRKVFSKELINEMKKRNINRGLNARQGLWMHHKMRALPVTFYGVNYTIDVLNMVISGDVELSCLALMNCELDDMTEPYHWLDAENRDWAVARLKAYLGWA